MSPYYPCTFMTLLYWAMYEYQPGFLSVHCHIFWFVHYNQHFHDVVWLQSSITNSSSPRVQLHLQLGWFCNQFGSEESLRSKLPWIPGFIPCFWTTFSMFVVRYLSGMKACCLACMYCLYWILVSEVLVQPHNIECLYMPIIVYVHSAGWNTEWLSLKVSLTAISPWNLSVLRINWVLRYMFSLIKALTFSCASPEFEESGVVSLLDLLPVSKVFVLETSARFMYHWKMLNRRMPCRFWMRLFSTPWFVIMLFGYWYWGMWTPNVSFCSVTPCASIAVWLPW